MADGRDTPTSEPLPTPQLETVADRLQKLEKQLANLQDPSVLEQQLANRILTRLQEQTPQALPSGLASQNGLSAFGAKVITAAAIQSMPGGEKSAESIWSFFQIFKELRLIAQMYLDPRYRVSRLAQIAVPSVFILMIGNYFFFGWLMIQIPLLTPVVERTVLIFLAIALYKVLSREAGRYNEVLQYLARYGS
ncbi:MAG: hypothetical protein ACRC8S_03920 [Fimbriiglobus sp.]